MARFDHLRIALPRGFGSRIFFAMLKADMAAIGLEVERVTIDKPHDLRLIDRAADQSSPAWYLDQLSCTVAAICSMDADRLVSDARMSTDAPTARAAVGASRSRIAGNAQFHPHR